MVVFRFPMASRRRYRRFKANRKPCLIPAVCDGRKVTVLLAHGSRNAGYKLPSHLWDKADVVVCCHPQMLDRAQRVKHLFPSHHGVVGGEINWLTGQWVVCPK